MGSGAERSERAGRSVFGILHLTMPPDTTTASQPIAEGRNNQYTFKEIVLEKKHLYAVLVFLNRDLPGTLVRSRNEIGLCSRAGGGQSKDGRASARPQPA